MRSPRWSRAVALVAVGALASCSSGSASPDDAAQETTTPRPADATTVPSPGDASAPTASTTVTVAPTPRTVSLGDALDAQTYWSMRTVALGEQFLELSSVGGAAAVARSTDGGHSWMPVATDLPLDGVAFAATNGRDVFVSSGYGSSESGPLTVSASSDGGATWAASPLPVAAMPGSPYVFVDTYLSAMAATDTAALALGRVVPRADWRTYSIEVLGVDHGGPTGEGGDPTNWEVTFEDGFTVMVDLAAVGMTEVAQQAGLSVVGWVRTASGWEAVELPFRNPQGDPSQLVAGPEGFLMMPPPAESSLDARAGGGGAGAVDTLLYHSADGRTWEASTPPDDFVSGDGFLVGGPLGYVIVGETALWFSTDGFGWDRAAEYEDAAPDQSGWLSGSPPAGGPAGFAVAFGAHEDPPTGVRVLVSSDGRTWEPVPLPAGTIDATVAVGSSSILVRPIVLASPGTDAPVDTSVIAAGVGGAGGRRPAAMCEAPESLIVVAYDLETGRYRWHRCGTGTFHLLVAATSDAVYVQDVGYNSPSPEVLVFDALSGETLEPVPAADVEAVLPDDAVRPMSSPPEIPGLTVTGGQDDRLLVSDTATGAERWWVSDFLPYDDVWAIGDGAVFMTHREDTSPISSIRAYELETGEIRWETPTPSTSCPWWVADGRVFSIWADLTVLSTATGEVQWATEYGTTGFPGMRGVLTSGDTVFVSFASAMGGGD